MTERTLNGRHVLAMFAGGFGIIIAVNITLAVNAIKTFPGLEVANSYVASQNFDARRAAQEALGWQARANYSAGIIRLTVLDEHGNEIDPSQFVAVIGRPTTRAEDQALTFEKTGRAQVSLAAGLWHLDVQSAAGTETFSHRLSLRVNR